MLPGPPASAEAARIAAKALTSSGRQANLFTMLKRPESFLWTRCALLRSWGGVLFSLVLLLVLASPVISKDQKGAEKQGQTQLQNPDNDQGENEGADDEEDPIDSEMYSDMMFGSDDFFGEHLETAHSESVQHAGFERDRQAAAQAAQAAAATAASSESHHHDNTSSTPAVVTPEPTTPPADDPGPTDDVPPE